MTFALFLFLFTLFSSFFPAIPLHHYLFTPLCITPFFSSPNPSLHLIKNINSKVYGNESSSVLLPHISLIGRFGLESIFPTDQVWVVRLGFIIMFVCACMHTGGNSVCLCVWMCLRESKKHLGCKSQHVCVTLHAPSLQFIHPIALYAFLFTR